VLPILNSTVAEEALDITLVPERCIIAGSALFSSCAMEIYTAQVGVAAAAAALSQWHQHLT
jgi:hypothetical protein